MKRLASIIIFLFCLIGVSFAQLKKQVPGHSAAYPMSVNPEVKALMSSRDFTSKSGESAKFNVKQIGPVFPTAGVSTTKSINAFGIPVWVEGDLLKSEIATRASVQQTAYYFLNENRSALKISNPESEFQLVQQKEDETGRTHLKFDQYYQGIPVWNSQIMLHFNHGRPYLFNGRFIPTPENLEITPKLNAEDAISNTRKELKFQNLTAGQLSLIKGKQVECKLIIYTNIYTVDPPLLAYKVDAYTNVLDHWTYFINANTGTVIDKIYETCTLFNHNEKCHNHLTAEFGSNFHPIRNAQLLYSPLDGPATSSAADLNGVNRTVNSYQIGNSYFLINTTKGMYKAGSSQLPDNPVGAIWTIDGLSNSPSNNNFNPGQISTNNNNWNSNPIAVSAQYNADFSYEYYKTKFNRNSIDGNGGNIISLINITEDDGSGLDNAFWNGAAMFYGNGAQAFKPLAGGLDVSGHEMTHGVVQATAGLTYENESGALNESFADIFGVFIDRDDYKMGEDVVRLDVFPSGALRDLSNPHNGGNSNADNGWQPAHMNEKYLGSEDNGGVHINSGIVNFAFYKVASQIGLDAAEKIYYSVLSNYLTKSSQFIDCRNAVIQATKDQFPGDQAKVTIVENAYSAVGIGAGSGTTEPDDYETNPGKDIVIYASPDKTTLSVKDLQTTQETMINNSIGVISKPSVSDDGSLAVFVGNDKKLYLAEFTWPNPTPQFYYILDPNDQNQFRNVAISKKGNLIACTLDDETPVIYIIDLVKGNIKDFKLYNPTTGTGDPSTADIKFADALEFNHTGDYVMFDAYNELTFQGTAYWDIGFLRAWDNAAQTFGDGKIEKLFGSLPPNTSVGNPVFSKNSPNIIAMDYVDENNNYYVVGADIEKGNTGLIYQNTDVNYPTFSKDDKYVIFNAQDNSGNTVIGVQELQPNKIEASTTNAFVLINSATLGNWFGTGSRALSSNEIKNETGNITMSPTLVTTSAELSWQAKQNCVAKVAIYDLTGRLVNLQNWDIHLGLNNMKVDCSQLVQGTYFVRVTNEKSTGVIKFQKVESN